MWKKVIIRISIFKNLPSLTDSYHICCRKPSMTPRDKITFLAFPYFYIFDTVFNIAISWWFIYGCSFIPDLPKIPRMFATGRKTVANGLDLIHYYCYVNLENSTKFDSFQKKKKTSLGQLFVHLKVPIHRTQCDLSRRWLLIQVGPQQSDLGIKSYNSFISKLGLISQDLNNSRV